MADCLARVSIFTSSTSPLLAESFLHLRALADIEGSRAVNFSARSNARFRFRAACRRHHAIGVRRGESVEQKKTHQNARF